MARGFNTTYGSGSTDRITLGSCPDPATISIHCWIWQHGTGGGGLGRVFEFGNGATAQNAIFNNGTNLALNRLFTTAGGQWTFARPTFDTWASLGYKYDNSNTTNDPTVYLNNTKKTVGSGLTEATSPSGTIIATNDAKVGNGASNIRVWDGIIAEFAAWSVLLDDDEFFALGKGFSPAKIRPDSLMLYDPMVRDNVSLKGVAATIDAGTAVQPHPPIFY